MISASLPNNETERLKELHSFEILDTEPEKQFEEIVKLAAHICGTPISLITLLDEHRQWFKARVGLDLPETSREVSFCGHALNEDQDDVFVVKDATTDARFYDNPLVTGSPHIQFYAGYPLKTANGQKLGTLCVIDTKKKELTPEQKIALELLAKQVIKELELRKAYRDLTQRNQMLHGILANMPVIAYRLQPDGIFKEAIGAGLAPLGFQDNQLVGQNSEKLFSGLTLTEEIEKALANGEKSFISSLQQQGKDCYYEHYIFPDETNPGGIVGFALDITHRKHIEQQLKEAKENAERATQAKSSFLANMSHEIRTPINAILGFAEVLKKQEQSPQSQEYLNYIATSGQILLKLIGDVLDLTKIEEGKLELHEETFHLTEVLKSNLHPYQYRAQEKGLKFNIEFDKNLPDYAKGDAGKISQIIINLIGNALKFTEQGEIKVRVSAEKPTGTAPITKLRVEVIDTGIGIPKEKQDQVFNSFTQADTSINRKFGGSGLGLSIVKELVERMGGKIGVVSPVLSEDGEGGSCFWFTIPLTIADPPSEIVDKPTDPTEINYQEKVHALLVDDNDLNRRLASIMLKNMGCQVSVAGNGQEAIELVKNNIFHLILMDIQMPILNGYEATNWLRNNLKITVPIIGLSANVYKEEIEQCFLSGMNDYLSKPYNERDLREIIRKWVPLPGSETKADNSQINQPQVAKLTDLTFLEDLFNGDKDSIKEMVNEFITQQQELIRQMEESLAGKNYPDMAKLSHHIRSSLMTVGLEALREPLTNLEKLIHDKKEPEVIEQAFGEVTKINSQAITELQLVTQA